ncbi:GT4 family glycosyltransferase PelF [Goodfellowiella coeruleoviolacea]|uniref:Glycosyltransferase involved in cell wall bisynthesis n=1 Tax=Goodfellowiella coeruleoviolacea TaxID=334858 RepID=A0AAE3GDY9_9PSEU|nr:GT4 family glycosyltransferase PelF [Goodfellowiella coeruleoviolacea]MCP2165537.1 Glycosyltransferase involved in cell wall bisynthesis [Goodfellowiella coeruleoviolacea]
MRIALMTEGTYPHSFGGVSVWCDQLVRGMGTHQFEVVALVGGAAERVTWELPANVCSVVAVPLWDESQRRRRPGRAARQRFQVLARQLFDVLLADPDQVATGAAGRPSFRSTPHPHPSQGGDPGSSLSAPAAENRVPARPVDNSDACGQPRPDRVNGRAVGGNRASESAAVAPEGSVVARFGAVLRALFDYAQDEDLDASLRGADVVRALLDAWQARAARHRDQAASWRGTAAQHPGPAGPGPASPGAAGAGPAGAVPAGAGPASAAQPSAAQPGVDLPGVDLPGGEVPGGEVPGGRLASGQGAGGEPAGPGTPHGAKDMTVLDALTVLRLIGHSLRPLNHPPVRADVAHCVANGLAVLPALAAKWAHGTPVLLTEHGIYLRERYLSYRNDTAYRWPVKLMHLAFLRNLCALAYREAASITPGNVYNQRWEERLGADNQIIRTVYNGVSPADFPPLEHEPELPTISWVGRIDPIKDLETLLRAFVLVHQQIPEARLRMFGSAPKGGQHYLDRCRELANRLGIGGAATFEGRIELIRDAYAAGHVVALSSISEGFPYSVIEAMTCGRACVATDVGGVSEAVGETGLVVPPRDPEAMAEAFLVLLRDNELRRQLGKAARERALEYFTVDRAVGTFEQIYAMLAGQHGGAR